MGVERLPSDTVRAKSNPATDHLARRVMRNLPPCAGELNDGEAWVRTADWKSLHNKRASRCDEKRAVDLKAMDELFSQRVGLGHTRSLEQPLVEPYCGSCGCKRADRHEITTDPALVYIHHLSDPAIHVSATSIHFVSTVHVRARVLRW